MMWAAIVDHPFLIYNPQTMQKKATEVLGDPRLADIVERILRVDHPHKIVLFGSRARKENGRLSDFDIALFGQINIAKVRDAVEEAKTLLKVDMVAFDEIGDENFKKKILQDGIVIYEAKI